MKKLLTIFSGLLLLPGSVFASNSSVSVQLPPGTVSVGDTILIPVMLNASEASAVNSLQARVTVSGSAHLTSVSTGGSVFTLWPENPVVKGDTASFTGGTPGSVYGSPLRVVTLAVTTTGAGRVVVSVTGITSYADDGKGTAHKIPDTSASFTVGQKGSATRNDFSDSLSKDSIAPDSFTITVGRDSSLYDGKYFITFGTTDTGSGVTHYEIKENNNAVVTTSDSSFVLSDQSLRGVVSVRAIDAAGNVRTETLRFKPRTWTTYVWIGAGLCIIGGYFFFRRRQRM